MWCDIIIVKYELIGELPMSPPKIELLSDIEYSVMEIFWDLDKPLTNPELQAEHLARHPNGIKTIHNITSRLANKGYIKEDSIIKAGNRFAQRYVASISALQYLEHQMKKNIILKKHPERIAVELFANIIDNENIDDSTLNKMQHILEQRKNLNV